MLASIGCNAPYADSGRRLLYDDTVQRFEKRSERIGVIRVEDTADAQGTNGLIVDFKCGAAVAIELVRYFRQRLVLEHNLSLKPGDGGGR